jgi:hypothetical protein
MNATVIREHCIIEHPGWGMYLFRGDGESEETCFMATDLLPCDEAGNVDVAALTPEQAAYYHHFMADPRPFEKDVWPAGRLEEIPGLLRCTCGTELICKTEVSTSTGTCEHELLDPDPVEHRVEASARCPDCGAEYAEDGTYLRTFRPGDDVIPY